MLNIYDKLQTCRVELQKLQLKKSGENKFAKFKYYELADFIPSINELFLKHKLFSNFSINENSASLTIYNAENIEEKIIFSTPVASAEVKGCTPIQSLGAIHTYLKRYLYLNALEIVENDALDPLIGNKNFNPNPKSKADDKKSDEDVEYYLTLDAIEDISMLKQFYEESKELVNDKKAFHSAVVKRQTELKQKRGE